MKVSKRNREKAKELRGLKREKKGRGKKKRETEKEGGIYKEREKDKLSNTHEKIFSSIIHSLVD